VLSLVVQFLARADDAADLTLAMHMLYHVPEPSAAVRELRRITHPGGQVLVVLNGEDHLRELRELIATARRDFTNGEPPGPGRLRLDEGEGLLAREFTSVTRHDFAGELAGLCCSLRRVSVTGLVAARTARYPMPWRSWWPAGWRGGRCS